MEQKHQPHGHSGRQGPVVGRRRLITFLLGFSTIATLGGILTPIIGYLWPPSRRSGEGGGQVQVGTSVDFPVGQGQVISVNDKPVIVVNTAQGGLKAFSAICSHLGCSPSGPFPAGANVQLAGDPGFVCPCHGSTFDLAGRVFKNKPAPQNLDVPPFMFLSDTKLVIGKDEKGEA